MNKEILAKANELDRKIESLRKEIVVIGAVLENYYENSKRSVVGNEEMYVLFRGKSPGLYYEVKDMDKMIELIENVFNDKYGLLVDLEHEFNEL